MTNDGSSLRGRGQQKQTGSNRESADVIGGPAEFGKKSRVTEYYNSQEQQPLRNAGTPNARIRNQFNKTPAGKDAIERDNNRIAQFPSRDQQQPQR